MKNFKLWLRGLAEASIAGSTAAAGGMIGAVVTGQDHIDYPVLGSAALGGGLIGAINYLRQSPLPPATKRLKKKTLEHGGEE